MVLPSWNTRGRPDWVDAVTRSKLPSEKRDGLCDTNWSGYTDLPCFSPRIASFDNQSLG